MKIEIIQYSMISSKIKNEVTQRVKQMKNLLFNCYWKEVEKEKYTTSCETGRVVEEFDKLNFCPYCGNVIIWLWG